MNNPEKILVKAGKGLSVNLLAAAMILDAEQNFDSKNITLCLKIFKSNNFFGLIVFLSIYLGKLNI